MTEKTAVLIIPAGSGMAIVAIKAIKKDSHMKIVAADMDPLAAGLHLAHKGYVVPPISDSSFFSKIDEIIEKEKVDVIVPCLDTFLSPFAKRRVFHDMGVKVVISPEKTISICRDKWRLYNVLKDKVPVPKSTIDFNCLEDACNSVGLPAILKPRSGSGSKDVYSVQDKDDLAFYLRKVLDPLLQHQIFGVEYTIDMLVDTNGTAVAVIPRKRLEVKAGISVKGVIELNDDLIEIGHRICENLQFFGPVNFQAVMDKKKKESYITEVNPRISGGMSLTIASGINIPLLSIYASTGKSINIKFFPKQPIYMTRYLEEIILSSEPLKH